MEHALSGDERSREAQMLVGQYGGPAFVRRARRVDEAWQQATAALPKVRRDYLDMVRLRVGTLVQLAGGFERLAALLPEIAIEAVRAIHDECRPELRVPVEATDSVRVLRQALEELRESVERFNRRWRERIEGLDLGPVNERREEFNRFYLLEKECALGSLRIARHGFRAIPPVSTADLFTQFSLLPEVGG
jgi:hypothetical protein